MSIRGVVNELLTREIEDLSPTINRMNQSIVNTICKRMFKGCINRNILNIHVEHRDATTDMFMMIIVDGR